MADKRVAVILYGADRELWAGSGATLVVRDLNRSDLRVLARHKLNHPTIDITLRDLAFDTGQAYGLTIAAKGHRPASQLIRRSSFLRQDGDRRIERADTIFRLMIVPTRPTPLDLSDGYQKLVALGSTLARLYSEQEYEDLEPAEQMAFLNMEAKLRETHIGQTDLLSYVTAVRGVESDRLFLFVESRLKDIIDRSADFAAAAGHPAPPRHADFPACPDSWKHTRFEFGNIQLSFSAVTRPGAAAGQDYHAIDTDIDLARGLGHVGEWLDNNVIRRGQKTSQTMIYALLFAQGILPVYRLTQ
jgi:hypothetical protein